MLKQNERKIGFGNTLNKKLDFLRGFDKFKE